MIKIILIMIVLYLANRCVLTVYLKGMSVEDKFRLSIKGYTKAERIWFQITGIFIALIWVLCFGYAVWFIVKYI